MLVTGGSGYIGSHVIVAALQKGYKVRTIVRLLEKADSVRENLRNGNIPGELVQVVEFVEVDLLGDKGWDEVCVTAATTSCTSLRLSHLESPSMRMRLSSRRVRVPFEPFVLPRKQAR